jgi:hypothetical protein
MEVMQRLLAGCVGSGLIAALACSPANHEQTPRPRTQSPDPGSISSPTTAPVQLYCIRGYEELHVDADGDGYGDNTRAALCPSDGRVPVGYVLYAGNGYDCDDSDPTKFDLYYRDADGDGVGTSQVTVCAGLTPPPGYLPNVGWSDCDDSDPTISYAYALDADGDGVLPEHPGTICGPKDHPPPHGSITSTYPPDCDDNDPNVSMPYYQDLDGDGCAGESGVWVCGNPKTGPPPGYGYWCYDGSADCDDTRTDVYPGAFEQWTDDVDSNCDGSRDPYGCSDGGTCDPAWFTLPVDASCATADLVITRATADAVCYGVFWMVEIGNQGAQPISSYTLTIESANGTTTIPITDALPPGTKYPYPLPDRWLSGTVKFTVTAAMDDCNPDNNKATQTGIPIDCLLP